MSDQYSTDKEAQPLLHNENDKAEESPPCKWIDRIWPYLVMLSSLVSFALGAGFNFGIAGSLTVAQSKRFNVSLDQASWSTSIHTVFFLMTSMH